MLSPVPLEIINALIHEGFPRELVMDAMIGAIRIEQEGGQIIEVKNDPLGEPDELTCPSGAQYYGPNGTLNDSPYSPAAPTQPSLYCQFHYFEFYLQAAMEWGFNVEVRESPNPAYSDAAAKQAKAAGKDPPPKTITQSRFCFDPAFARDSQKKYVMTFVSRCGTDVPMKASGADQKDLTVQFTRGNGLSPKLKFIIIPRSPFALFAYLGHILRTQSVVPVRLYWQSLGAGIEADNRILAITQSQNSSCFAETYYFGSFYCVPYRGSDTTKQVFAMLAQVIALSTTAGSLPTTLEVRLQ